MKDDIIFVKHIMESINFIEEFNQIIHPPEIFRRDKLGISIKLKFSE